MIRAFFGLILFFGCTTGFGYHLTWCNENDHLRGHFQETIGGWGQSEDSVTWNDALGAAHNIRHGHRYQRLPLQHIECPSCCDSGDMFHQTFKIYPYLLRDRVPFSLLGGAWSSIGGQDVINIHVENNEIGCPCLHQPEPSTFILALFGLLAILTIRRRN